MKRISFNPRFVNEAGNSLIPGKLHTIRANYDYWKRFEGKNLELFTWEGKPYQKGSKHKVFCVKRLVYVQEVYMQKNYNNNRLEFLLETPFGTNEILDNEELAKNDGFRAIEFFEDWFVKYTDGVMGILHFTDFWY
jgi:hypothetical protein